MTRERLEGLPMTVLLDLALRENVPVDDGMSRPELIEELLEAFEEDSRERETLQNLILKMEQAKFQYPLAAERGAATGKEPVLPASYDENRVDLVLRDPQWALALWEVRKKDLDAVTQEPTFRGLALRVHEYEAPGQPSLTFFPIPVPQSSGSRYLHLPTPGHWYALELHIQTDRESRALARSGLILAPDEVPDDPKQRPGLTPEQVRILDVSGSALCETVRGRPDLDRPEYPQRIGGWDESLFGDAAE